MHDVISSHSEKYSPHSVEIYAMLAFSNRVVAATYIAGTEVYVTGHL